MTEIGNYIKQNRIAAGYSLKKLSKLSGISDSEIFKIENGERKTPNWKFLCEIAKNLDIHPLEILHKAGYIQDEDIKPIHRVKSLNKLSDADVTELQQFIDFLVSKSSDKKGQGERE